MRLLVATDDFMGTLSAPEACAAIAEGWLRTRPDHEVMQRPLSDGGPGFVASLASARGIPVRQARVTGPRGETVEGAWCMDATTAYIESAQACGLRLVPGDHRDPLHATTRGVGELLLAAIGEGAERIVIGLGGSATNDLGLGALEALGALAFDAQGRPLPDVLSAGPAAFAAIAAIDLLPARQAVAGIELVIATDVDNPLLGPRGAARTFAAQKGADVDAVEALEVIGERISALCGARPDGRNPAVALGAGAAGGLGFGLLHLGAQRVAGIDTVWDESGVVLEGVDCIITGEGALDWQTLRGKVVTGVARRGQQRGIPVIALCGRVDVTPRERMDMGLAAAYSMSEFAGTERAISHAAATLGDLAARVARTWG